jgi:hypothetical protein
MKIGLVVMFLKRMDLVRFDCWGSFLTPTYNNAPIPVMPRRALAVLSGIARRGAAGSRTLPEGQGCPFWQTPIKLPERRKQAASGGFLLDTFLCPRKEKYLVRGYENPH